MSDKWENPIIRLFEHCDYSCDPSSDVPYIPEMMEIPHAQLADKVVPQSWVRSAALHLRDTRQACDEVCSYLRLIPAYLEGKNGPITQEWRDTHLPVVVSDELRFHIFCFLPFSEIIRDTIRNEIEAAGEHLIASPQTDPVRPLLSVDAISRALTELAGADESQAQWVARQLSCLDQACDQTRNALDEFAEHPDAGVLLLVQRFARVQSTMLNTAAVLLSADYAVDVWGGFAAAHISD